MRVRIAKSEGPKLEHRDEPAQIRNFSVRITTIENTRKIEKLCALINLGPETFFQHFLSVSLRAGLLDEIKVREHANDFGKPMGLKDVQKLECFLGKA